MSSPALVQSISPKSHISLDVPSQLYEKALTLALRQNTDIDSIVADALQRYVHDEEFRALYHAASELADGPEECDVNFAFEAQAEVVLADE